MIVCHAKDTGRVLTIRGDEPRVWTIQLSLAQGSVARVVWGTDAAAMYANVVASSTFCVAGDNVTIDVTAQQPGNISTASAAPCEAAADLVPQGVV